MSLTPVMEVIPLGFYKKVVTLHPMSNVRI